MKKFKQFLWASFYGWASLSALQLADHFIPDHVCKIDPTCRAMTNDEAQIAHSVFGKDFNVASVQIFERPMIQYFLIGLLKGHFTKATTNDNAIYFTTLPVLNHKMLEVGREYNPAEYRDYNGIANRLNLVHELTHIAQHQFKIPFNKNVPDYTYDYQTDDHKNFEDFGLEQQAGIVAEFYRTVFTLSAIEKTHRTKGTIKYLCNSLKQDAKLFAPYFAPQLPNACASYIK